MTIHTFPKVKERERRNLDFPFPVSVQFLGAMRNQRGPINAAFDVWDVFASQKNWKQSNWCLDLQSKFCLWSCSSAVRKILPKRDNLQSVHFSSHLAAAKSWTQLTAAWITKERAAFWFSSSIPKPFYFKTRKNLIFQRLLLITWNWNW